VLGQFCLFDTFALSTAHLRNVFPLINIQDVATTHAGGHIECETLDRVLVVQERMPMEYLLKYRCEDARLYESGNNSTRAYAAYAATTINIFEKYVQSSPAMLYCYFTKHFFDEWFTLLPSTAFPQDSATIPNFKFLSRHSIDHNPAAFFANPPNIFSNSNSSSNFSDKLLNLLPLPPTNQPIDTRIIQKRVQLSHNVWKKYGSRAVYLQQYLNGNLTYEEAKHFRNKVLAVHIIWSRYTPIVNKEKSSVNRNEHNFTEVDKFRIVRGILSEPSRNRATDAEVEGIIRIMV
jgi:hypothetical protein